MPVRIDDIRGVIMRVIMRSQSWPALVNAAGGKRRSVEFINRRARMRSKRDMQPAVNRATTADKELRQLPATKARPSSSVFAMDVNQSLDAEGCKRGHIERPTEREIANGKVNVIEHS